jgi:hypothetical protein
VDRITFSKALDRCFRLRQINPDINSNAPSRPAAGRATIPHDHRFWGKLFSINIFPKLPHDNAGDCEQPPYSFLLSFPNRSLTESTAIPTGVRKALVGQYTSECRRRKNVSCRISGYSNFSIADHTVRSHPSYRGAPWYDWVLTRWSIDGAVYSHGGNGI